MDLHPLHPTRAPARATHLPVAIEAHGAAVLSLSGSTGIQLEKAVR